MTASNSRKHIELGNQYFENGDFKNANPYYQHLTSRWDREYSEIPQKSVIIFNDIDFLIIHETFSKFSCQAAIKCKYLIFNELKRFFVK